MESFRPAWWLPGPHLQTIWGKFAPRGFSVPLRKVRLDTADGDFIDLYRLDAAPTRPRLLFLHGLEGSVRSHYVRGMFEQARRREWGADLFVFRSCGEESNRLPRSYHSGETSDLSFVLEELLREFPACNFGVAGFSLGGNVLLKWLGEQGSAVPERVRAFAAVSVPFDLDRSCSHLARGFSRMYDRFFVRQLNEKARVKRARFPARFAAIPDRLVKSLRDFDDAFTAPLHGFRDASDYYARSSSLQYLDRIARPTLLLSAVDDPFLPAVVLDEVREHSRRNSCLELDFPAQGGHVGFVGGGVPWRPFYYAEWKIAEYLAERIEGGGRAVAGARGTGYNPGQASR